MQTAPPPTPNAAPVRFGVLGIARVFERRMIPGFAAAPNAELVAVASRTEAKAQSAAARHNIARAYGDYDALLANPVVEAVYIPLPNDQHVFWTLRALEGGKHVLCDKPLALTYADARTVADAAARRGLRVLEGFMFRHHPQHARVRALLESGEIGTPVRFEGAFSYPANFAADNIRLNAAQGGGAFLDVGVYPVNAARFLFGEPVAVSAAARPGPATGVDFHTTVLMKWANGATGTATGGFDQPFASRYTVFGTGGSITAERAFQIGDSGVTLTIRSGSNGDDTRTERFAPVDQYGLEISHFAACVRDPTLPLAPGEVGVEQARVVEAVLTSVREGRRVVIGAEGQEAL